MKPVNGAYAQYGCGLSAPPEWENFDSSLTLRWERTFLLGKLWTKNAERFPAHVKLGDIVKGLPLREESCRGVYASHVLEHLALEDCYRAIENTRKILAPGGIFRLIVPDLVFIADKYRHMVEQCDPEASQYFMMATDLGEKARKRGPLGFFHQALNTSRHLWMWDEFGLRKALEDRGFERVRRCGYSDCEDPMFALVEHPSRFDRAVAMEARRA